MNSVDKKGTPEFSFCKPATYQIKVKGILEQRFSGYFEEMQIKVFNKSKDEAFSVLTGSVSDQSALSGILNSLYEMHLTIMYVKQLTGNDEY